ncbi:MAG: hypothetical protein H6608_02155 [Flavobacteriales bacterium]|nr:hypothetical protein [Bacteroidota bacterium]MCB9239910.1 hypothetical protein [Flavobacteriales bacterium]
MKKPLILTVLGLVLLAAPAFTQTNEELEDRFFMSFHSSTYLDFVRSPLRFQNVPSGNVIDPTTGQKEYVDAPVQTANINIFSFGLEPRFNLREFDDNSALAVSAPFTIGLGQSYPSNLDVLGVEGIGAFQLPLLMKLYIGSGSTYKSEKDFGLSVGGGMELNKVGLLRMEETSSISAANRAWIMPVASISVHFWRGYNPVEINLKYGAGSTKEYYYDRFGNALEDANGNITSGRTKSQSFRMCVSYLLNY